jgi:hypothetical protein
MFKKIMPYQLRKVGLMAMLAAMPAFISCQKDNTETDPLADLKKEYAAMQLDSTNMAEAIKHYTDVELAAPTTQYGLRIAFWRKAVVSPFPISFADSVKGKKPDGTIHGGYKAATITILNQYGPTSGYNALTTASVDLLNNIGSSADTYTSFLTPIANKRLELLAAQGK